MTISQNDIGEIRSDESTQDLIEVDDFQQRAGETIETYGSVHAIRKLSQVTFVIIRTFRDKFQAVFSGQDLQILDGIMEGDYIRIMGKVLENPEAYKGFELAAERLEKIGGPKGPLPMKLGSKVPQSFEAGYDNELLSLRRLDERAILKLNGGVIRAFSSYMETRRFTEIHLSDVFGSTNKSEVRSIQNLRAIAYRQSLLPIFGRVYEIGSMGDSSQHAGLSCEIGYLTSHKDLLSILAGFMQYLIGNLNDSCPTELGLLQGQLPTMDSIACLDFETARERVGQKYGYRFSNKNSMQSEEKALVSRLMLELTGNELFFLTGLPAANRPLYAMPKEGDPRHTEEFILFFRGHELATGGQRIHDYDMQVHALITNGIDPSKFDEYLKLHKYGLPPHGGFTIDLEVLVKQLFYTSQVPTIRHPQYQTQANDPIQCEQDFQPAKFLFGNQRISPFLLNTKNAEVEQSENDQVVALLNVTTSTEPLLDAEGNISGSLAAILSHFAMEMEDVEFLLNLLPKQKPKILQCEPEKILQFLWSILGHDHIREWLKNPELRGLVKKLADMKVLTDYKQMRFLHKDALSAFDVLYQYCSDSSEDEIVKLRQSATFVKFVRRLLANTPNDFATIMHNLTIIADKKQELPIDNDDEKILLDAIPDGCTTPILFSIYRMLHQNRDRLQIFLSLIRNKFSYIHENREINSVEINEEFYREMLEFRTELGPEFYAEKKDVFPEIIYHLYRPINMDICALAKHLNGLKDHTADIKELGLVFSGPHWEESSGCYSFEIGRDNDEARVLQLYFSKNVASFFAKASAGICTLNDIQLFQRKDHLHLNLVDGGSHITVGNVQLYMLKDRGKNVLMLRAINPSDSYVSMENGSEVFKSIVQAAVEMAQKSCIDEICVSESMGVWHAQSSRAPIKAILALLYNLLEEVRLESPLCIYNYPTGDKYIQTVYKVWSAK